MTENHPITPPPEMLQQWATEYWGNPGESIGEGEKYIATQAARWGANQELEACCKLLDGADIVPPDGAKTYPENLFAARERISKLRAARRPKPPSLAKQGCDALDTYIYGNSNHKDKERTYNTIRAALDRLQELEKGDG